MKTFEISNRKTKNGRRKFKVVLHQIFPDSCVDEVNEVGTQFNLNGITWIREYCENVLSTIVGMSLRCEFVDEDRTELFGHGYTDRADGDPIFENAVQIGTFTKGYITEIEDNNGEMITVCVGEGEIDALCYHNFVTKLDEDIKNGNYPFGSVEILHTDDNEGIVYKYGYKDEGRIPVDFVYSGYALLGIQPADDSARLLELNEKRKEDLVEMNEDEIKAVVKETVQMISERNAEIEQIQDECNQKIAEANSNVETAIAEKNEIEASVEELKAAIEALKAEKEELNKKYEELWAEREELEKALAEAQAKERLANLDNALAEFSESEQNYAKDEIAKFRENPLEGEVNSIVDLIHMEIGKAVKAEAATKAAEQNSVDNGDIFEEVHASKVEEDESIF